MRTGCWRPLRGPAEYVTAANDGRLASYRNRNYYMHTTDHVYNSTADCTHVREKPPRIQARRTSWHVHDLDAISTSSRSHRDHYYITWSCSSVFRRLSVYSESCRYRERPGWPRSAQGVAHGALGRAALCARSWLDCAWERSGPLISRGYNPSSKLPVQKFPRCT